MKAEIDLTIPRLLRYSALPSGEIEATDDLTFDPDPASDWHCRGYGRSQQEALADLLEQLAEATKCIA